MLYDYINKATPFVQISGLSCRNLGTQRAENGGLLHKKLDLRSALGLRLIISIILCCQTALFVNARVYNSTEFNLYFNVNQSYIDCGYLNNANTLDSLRHYLALNPHTDSVIVHSVSSPDGPMDFNIKLARKRASATGNLLMRMLDSAGIKVLVQERVSVSSGSENWAGLESEVAASYHYDNREQLLGIIRQEIPFDEREAQIKSLDNGITMRRLTSEHMAKLRTSVIEFKSTPLPQPELVRMEDAGVIMPSAAILAQVMDPPPCVSAHPVVESESGAGERSPFRIAVKSNLLYDIFITPNIELEYPFKRGKWSINGEYWFPWYIFGNHGHAYQFIYGGLEGRYWLGDRTRRDLLTGHFIGAYAGGGYYDLEWEHQGYQGEFFVLAGVSYGYAARLSEHLRLEFNLGVGYMQTDYLHYHGMENDRYLVWQEDGSFSWFGPTKAKVSLVYLLGGKGAKNRKGVAP